MLLQISVESQCLCCMFVEDLRIILLLVTSIEKSISAPVLKKISRFILVQRVLCELAVFCLVNVGLKGHYFGALWQFFHTVAYVKMVEFSWKRDPEKRL